MILLKRYHDLEQEDSNLTREIESCDSNILNRDIQQMFQIRQLSWLTCNILRLVCQFTAQYLSRFYPTVNGIIHKMEISRKWFR